LISVLKEIVEVAIDSLRWNRERGHTRAAETMRRRLEQQRLLDFEADVTLPLMGLCEFRGNRLFAADKLILECISGLEFSGSGNDALL
jgi:hypothetical protein